MIWHSTRIPPFRYILTAIVALTILVAGGAVLQKRVFSQPDVLRERTNLPSDLAGAAALYETDVIEIKFQEALVMRLREGAPRSLAGNLDARAADALARISAGGVWLRSHTLSESQLDGARRTGQARSGRTLPDLNSYMRFQLPPEMDAVSAVRAFAGLESVEAAYLIPRPVPVADVGDYLNPSTSVMSLTTDPYQRYLDPAPAGIDARWAWEGAYGTGAGMRICDVEYDYNADHTDQHADRHAIAHTHSDQHTCTGSPGLSARVAQIGSARAATGNWETAPGLNLRRMGGITVGTSTVGGSQRARQ